MVCNIQIYKNIPKMDIYTEILKYAILFNTNKVSITNVMNDVSTFFEWGVLSYPCKKVRGFCLGGFCPRGFCPRGFCPEGVLSYIRINAPPLY